MVSMLLMVGVVAPRSAFAQTADQINTSNTERSQQQAVLKIADWLTQNPAALEQIQRYNQTARKQPDLTRLNEISLSFASIAGEIAPLFQQYYQAVLKQQTLKAVSLYLNQDAMLAFEQAQQAYLLSALQQYVEQAQPSQFLDLQLAHQVLQDYAMSSHNLLSRYSAQLQAGQLHEYLLLAMQQRPELALYLSQLIPVLNEAALDYRPIYRLNLQRLQEYDLSGFSKSERQHFKTWLTQAWQIPMSSQITDLQSLQTMQTRWQAELQKRLAHQQKNRGDEMARLLTSLSSPELELKPQRMALTLQAKLTATTAMNLPGQINHKGNPANSSAQEPRITD